MKLESLSFDKIEKYLKKCKSIIIPVGSTEQHSKALPLSSDTLFADVIANNISKYKKWLIGPTINIGYSDKPQPFMRFSGTITYTPDTLKSVIYDYVSSVYSHGFRNIFFVNAHGGNNKFIKQIAPDFKNRFNDIKLYLHNWWKIEEVVIQANEIDKNALNHAGTLETALALYLYGDKVNKGMLTKEYNYIETETGVIDSDQTIATKEMGNKFFELIIEESFKEIDNNINKYLIE